MIHGLVQIECGRGVRVPMQIKARGRRREQDEDFPVLQFSPIVEVLELGWRLEGAVWSQDS